ncbi:hypothetical protein HYFRA_00002787 [Hymenoscyphus fraxineus]|uniref:Uncharacterized protein n=1 Tax=Hymenoscyphus fraxineus TaxID=746836 RepID=A0A9N9KPV4_9HELO|nr:hypothetical protein HYFRA_00002787 [Hymenoscyphus fraxineus]
MPTEILQGGLPYTYLAPPCSCKICCNSFRDPAVQVPPSGASYSLELTDSQSKSIASKHLQNIKQDLTYLREQWSSNGKTIASRWKKKSRDKRVGYLTTADPNLFEKQWFAPMFTNKELGRPTQFDARKYRQIILLDYLTIDGLKSDPTRLLGLLQNRILHGPEEWAIHDNQKLNWGWKLGFLDIDASNLCMLMHGPRYGELVEWDARAAHAEEIIGFPRARMVLEAQEILLKFLRKVVEQLVEGIKPDSDQPSLPLFRVELKRSGRIDLWSTYVNQPFSPPPFFDINDMMEKAIARKNMVGDHLWLIQTDPAYLRRVIQIAAEGYPEGHPTEEVHDFAVAEIYYNVWCYWSWATIVEACVNVRTMQLKFRDFIYPGRPLPPKYEQVLQELELLLDCQFRLRLEPLPMMLSWRPGFRKYFKFDHSHPDQVAITGLIDIPKVHSEDPLFFILHTLPIDPDAVAPENSDLATKWAFLEDHLANTTQADSARLDEILYERYTDYAAIQELFANVHRHLPMPPLLVELDSFEPEKIQSLGRPTVLRHQIERITEEYYMRPHDKDGSKALLRFTKAFDSHLTKADLNDQMRLEQFNSTRAALANFWSLIRRKRQSAFKIRGKVWSAEDIAEDLKLISADLEPSYQDIVAAERQKIVDRIQRLSHHPPPNYLEPAQREWGSTPSAPSASTKANSRSKKSRTQKNPEQLPNIEKLSIATDKVEETTTAKPFPVKAPTLRILNTMFSSTAEAASKLINWDDFVIAMSDVGFKSRQTTGSEVVFQPEENDRGWSGRINFHKPHPVGKIDRVMMRAIGKRMGRWYGWKDGLFVLKAK